MLRWVCRERQRRRERQLATARAPRPLPLPSPWRSPPSRSPWRSQLTVWPASNTSAINGGEATPASSSTGSGWRRPLSLGDGAVRPERHHQNVSTPLAAASYQYEPSASVAWFGVASTCGLAELWDGAWRVDAVWADFCVACGWTCVASLAPQTPTPPPATLLTTSRMVSASACAITPTRARFASLPHSFVHFAWDPAATRELYHRRGSALRAVIASERAAADAMRLCVHSSRADAQAGRQRGSQTNPLDPSTRPGPLQTRSPAAQTRSELEAPASHVSGPDACSTAHSRTLVVRVDRMRSAASWRAAWAAAFAAVLRVDVRAVDELVRRVAEPHRAAFMQDLRERALRPSPSWNASLRGGRSKA